MSRDGAVSFAALRAAWRAQLAADGKLTAAGFRAGLGLEPYFNADAGGDAWPSVARVADDIGAHPRHVQKGIAKLVERGHIEVRGGGGRGRTNTYRMQLKERQNGRGFRAGTTPDPAPIDEQKLRPFEHETTPDPVGNYAHSGKKLRRSGHPTSSIPRDDHVKTSGGRSRGSRMHHPVFNGDLEIREDVARGFIEHRKALKSPLSERAVTILCNELQRIKAAGIDPNDALDMAIERGWRSCKLEWVLNAMRRGGGPANGRGPISASAIAQGGPAIPGGME